MSIKSDIMKPLEITVKGLTYEEAIEEFWGKSAWYDSRPINEDTLEKDNFVTLAIYNDVIDDKCQVGTLTEVYTDNDNNKVDYLKIYRDFIC